jgi:hypothetical protein
VIYAPSQVISKINALVLATGLITPVERDQYGKLVRMYAGIPIVDPGYATDGTTQILAYDETMGASSLTTSVYAVKFGEQEFVSGLTNGGIDVYDLGELETKPAYRHRVEAYMAIGIFNGKAASRASPDESQCEGRRDSGSPPLKGGRARVRSSGSSRTDAPLSLRSS